MKLKFKLIAGIIAGVVAFCAGSVYAFCEGEGEGEGHSLSNACALLEHFESDALALLELLFQRACAANFPRSDFIF